MQSDDNSNIARLAQLSIAASLPVEARWLGIAGVAAMLDFEPSYAKTVVKLPGFPAPLQVKGTGHKRYLASEVMEWAKGHREQSAK